MIRIITIAIILFISHVEAGECVVLLHGLARSASSMNKMAQVLTDFGYTVYNVDYDSRHFSIDSLTNGPIDSVLLEVSANNYDKINFVTHSMGGILVRNYLADHQIDNLGRVVMLGPPNKGSEVVDTLREWYIFKKLNGPAGQELGTEDTSKPNTLENVSFELGIIAGDWTINFINSFVMIPGKDDGKVSVESTKISGMKDHIIMHVTHPLMMKDDTVIAQVITFLKTGEFNK